MDYADFLELMKNSYGSLFDRKTVKKWINLSLQMDDLFQKVDENNNRKIVFSPCD